MITPLHPLRKQEAVQGHQHIPETSYPKPVSVTLNNTTGVWIKLFLTLAIAFIAIVKSSAQGPCPSSNCTSGDIRITKVELLNADGSQLPNTCTANTSIPVKLRVTFDVTSATRYGFLVVANVYLNNSIAGTIAQCDPATFSQGLHTMDVDHYANGNPILWPCGNVIQLKDVYTAWDQQAPSQSHPGICSYLNPANGAISDCQTIAPKCKYYGESEAIVIVAPLMASFTAQEGVCNNLKRSWTFTSTTTGGVPPYTYTWNFGDGTPPLVTTQNPVTHEYAYGISGNINVTLSVEDAASPTHHTSSTQPTTISVTGCCVQSTNPTGASAANPTICTGSSTNISVVGGTLGTNATWKWYTGSCDGTYIGSGSSISVNPTQTTTYYVKAEGDCNTTTCASVQVVVNQPSIGGMLMSPKTICSGGNSGQLSLSGNLGTVQRWESSTVSGAAGFSTISNTAGLTSYTSGPLTQDTWFRVYVKNGACPETVSNVIKITVQQPIANNTIAAPQTICSNTTPAALTGSTPTGGDGNYSYQWQSRSGGGWNDISGANSKDYAPGALGQTTEFRRIVSAGSACSNNTSTAITISISPESQVYAIQGSNFCISNPNTGTVTISGSYPGVSYQLRKTSDNSDVQLPVIGDGNPITWVGLEAGSYYVFGTGIAPSYCTSTTASVNVMMFDCSVFYTLTQGYYGGKNGKSCYGNNPVNTIKYLLGNVDLTVGDLLYNSVTVPATNEGAMKLNQTLPGGGPANKLPNGNCIITTGCFAEPLYLTKQGRINNILLSQTITLSLNVRFDAGKLLLFPIKNGYLTTQKMKGCGESAILVETCENGTISSILMNPAVVSYLGSGATVADLLQLANDLLSGVKVPGVNGVPSYDDVTSAVDCINKSFDEGRRFLNYFEEYQTCEMIFPPPIILQTAITSARISDAEEGNQVTVSAYPNPFSDNLNFVIVSKKSGYGTLEVYNMTGQKVKTVYQGNILAGTQRFSMNLSTQPRSNLFYILTVGNERVSGKLLYNGRK